MRSASRSLFVLAAVFAFPVLASAQAAQSATPTAKPAATAPKPAAAPMAKPATAAAMMKPATAPVAATPMAKPAPAAAAAPVAAAPVAKKAGPARDANGRFIAKSAAPAAAGAAVSATCKDGSTWSGKQRSGACARHGGVKAFN